MTNLDGATRARLRAALASLAGELAELHAALADTAAPVSPSESLGRLTRLDAMQDQALAVSRRADVDARRLRVERALRAIDEPDGDYGICIGCDEPIASARLDAMPDALLCIGCQAGRDG
jgi:DnaK suppressor protein